MDLYIDIGSFIHFILNLHWNQIYVVDTLVNGDQKGLILKIIERFV